MGNLPFTFSPFVGREDELGGVADQLRRHRLVTLTGPAGIGKTRLAIQTATALGDEVGTPQLVDLAIVKDATAILDAVALVFSLRQSRHRPLAEALVARLATEPVLLILDNCEHLVEACASTAGFLLQSCPSLRVLATSRQAFEIPGEVVCRVPPLGSDCARSANARRLVRWVAGGRPDEPRIELTEAAYQRLSPSSRRPRGTGGVPARPAVQ